MHSILIDLLIFTTASILFVPLFKWLKLGAILAYLFAGILIGPGALGLIKDTEVILHFSELGVVFLLFIIGLELAPAKLWQMRRSIFGLGFGQVVITGLLFCGIGILIGLPFASSFVLGFGLALSSTAFAIQILEENRQLKTTHGQGSFSILMFQDLAVVPLLASLAFFVESDGQTTLTWFAFIKAIAVLAALVLLGPKIVRYILRLVADTRIHEVFIAMSLFVVVGTGLLLESVGLSMGMGAFMAGVLLAESEYRHELESNLMPFKGLLLGLFFIAVGMSLDLNVVVDKPHWILALTVGFMSLKGLIIWGLGRFFKYPGESARNMAFTLPQGGEFAFVLFSAALAQNLLDRETVSIASAAVTVSMALTPMLFSFNQKRLRRVTEISERPYDTIDETEVEVIIAGFGRFGQIVSRFIKSQGVKFTILEHSAAQVDTARKFGSTVYYGDASRSDILEAAGAKEAKYFVLAIDDPEKSVETARVVKEQFPNMQIIARARNRQHVIELMRLGVKVIHRETLLTSLEVAKEIMLLKGESRDTINKQLAKFRSHDEDVLKQQLQFWDDEQKLISFTAKANQELETILRADTTDEHIVQNENQAET